MAITDTISLSRVLDHSIVAFNTARVIWKVCQIHLFCLWLVPFVYTSNLVDTLSLLIVALEPAYSTESFTLLALNSQFEVTSMSTASINNEAGNLRVPRKKTVLRFNDFQISLYFRRHGLSVSWDKKYSLIHCEAFEVVEFFDSPVENIVLKTEFF